MSSSFVPAVGERIRQERVRREMTVRALARAIGVSASLISQIETGKSQPSVSTLYAITQALGISVEDVFDAPEADTATAAPAGPGNPSAPPSPPSPPSSGAVSDAAPGASAGDAAGDAAAEAGRRVGPLVQPTQRDTLELDSGVTWQRLGRVPGTHADFLLVTYASGGCSSSTGQLMRHRGVEYGYLIEGELLLSLGFEEYRLGPGDAVSFASATPHRYRNDGDRPAVGVWFVYEPDDPW